MAVNSWEQPLPPGSAAGAAAPAADPGPVSSLAEVAIVILNYNGAHFLRQFLPGVLAHAGGARVVVADNASTDDSLGLLRTEFPMVDVLAFRENLGFCEGYNQALARLDSPYFVLLNSDVAVQPGWLPPLYELLRANPHIAAAQPKILAYDNPTLFEHAGAGGGYLDELGYPFCRGRLFDTLETDHGQYDDPRPVAWASGACCLVRATAWRALGGFEPAFFAHMEEIDFCWRAQNAGYEIWYHGGGAVHHVGGGTLPKTNPHKTYLNFRNGLALLFKNTAPGELASFLILRVLLDWVAGLRFLAAGSWQEARAVGRAHLHFVLRLGYWRRRRRLAKPRWPASQRPGTYLGSIVWAYFGQDKKQFSQLPSITLPKEGKL